METWKSYFPARYFKLFTLFFVLWYPGEFLIFTLFQSTVEVSVYLALTLYHPLILGLFSYLYFRKSKNDWNDRFVVAFGWFFLSIILSAILAGPVLGFSWKDIINIDVIKMSWVGIFVVIVAALFAKKSSVKKIIS